MKEFSKLFPIVVVGLACLGLLVWATKPSKATAEFDYDKAGQIPVSYDGRTMPLDTAARVALMEISKKQTFKDETGKSQPAVKWALDVMTSRFTKGTSAQKYEVFRVEHPQVLELIGVEAKPGSYRYSIEEFLPKMEKIEQEAVRADHLEPSKRDLYDVKIMEFARHIQNYIKVATFQSPLMVPPASASSEEWQALAPALAAAMQSQGQFDSPTTRQLTEILVAYAEKKPEVFNREVSKYLQQMQSKLPADTERARLEVAYNQFEPFFICTVLYVFVFLLAVLGWLGWSQPLQQAAFYLCCLTLVIHTGALFARMYLMDRPFVFVTNLYSSAIFIGWGCVALCLVLERLYRNGLGNVMAATLGFLTMQIAHFLFLSVHGETLEVKEAVLDTNFWLATHVTCVTFGYTATFVAGFIGMLYVLAGVFTRLLDRQLSMVLGQAIYGVICFATLLSFLGTVLGGIWADQSWGRFWGWDPKENGALLIVIWNALILHGRWAGLIKVRGMAVLAVAGNMITAWSWFGTNQLGVGLHAYGFNNTLATGCAIFWLSQLAVIGVGLLPQAMWMSNRTFGRPQPQPL